MTDYHPDKSLARSGGEYEKLRAWWDEARGALDVDVPKNFSIAMNNYLQRVQPYLDELRVEQASFLAKHAEKDLDEIYDLLGPTKLHQAMQVLLAVFQVVSDYLIETYEHPSYALLAVDKRYHALCDYEYTKFKESLDWSSEHCNTEFIVRHAMKVYKMCGEKMYFVSPGLEWELRNTELRKMPEEFLRLPYPSIYIVLPTKEPFKVFNDQTGWHDVEGIYLVEDEYTKPRVWRVILTGKPNENSKHKFDDALYHWTIYFHPGSTVEECIDFSTKVGMSQIEEAKREVVGPDGSICEVLNRVDPASEVAKIFKMMREPLLESFRYVMNVVLYASHPDAEVHGFNSNPEYDKLRQRAMKAPKGKKRARLFERSRSLRGKDRLLLGGSVVVNRKEAEAAKSEGSGVKGKQKVRTYVAGHWQHYWVGEGRTKRIYKRKRPFWRGPEDAPVTQKTHKLT